MFMHNNVGHVYGWVYVVMCCMCGVVVYGWLTSGMAVDDGAHGMWCGVMDACK